MELFPTYTFIIYLEIRCLFFHLEVTIFIVK